ncbi:disease resistance protein RGA2-like, partial [Jatropha curcas]|uniref:disease resistance protein RGA2-like n=1 Tax=Jatropha curcas TaxID=180498 RepID=UPI00189421FF
MSESFLFNTAESVLGKLTALALQEFFLAWGLEDDLKGIKKMLLAIKAVLYDAEQRQSQSQRIEHWLRMLKDVLYDTEDVIDEFECEALRRQVVKSGSTTRKVRRFFSTSNPLAFRLKLGHELKNIRKRVAEIASLKSDFGLNERINDNYVIHREREMTHSFVDAANENVSIIPIVGIGGMGKTTLAQLVCNDPRVVTHFELKLWVCVSDNFHLQTVIIKILNCVSTGQRYVGLDIEQLQRALREALQRRRYLLVLDDVWNEDRNKWLDLKTLLMVGANGSTIIATTRSNDVAKIMGTVASYALGRLPEPDCLSLFFRCAFGEVQNQNPNLIHYGEQIVSKCKGVPLAVITLGTLLYSVTDDSAWKFVMESEIWKLKQKDNYIMPALKLSYELMPAYLKRCFAYCSIFPKDYPFDDVELVYFWMSHGLIQSSNENEELENVGLSYFQELCSRCFFQEFYIIDGHVKCKMHDLIHDLALSVTQNECLTVINGNEPLSDSIRHLSFPYPQLLPQDLPTPLQDLDSVRTVSILNERNGGVASEVFIETCISKFKYLRTLDLGFSRVAVLPRGIAKLKHLRYLSLYGNIRIKRLPESICKLQSLQTLLLGDCDGLRELPKDIKYLISLRMLWITTQQRYLPNGGIGCLGSLRYLFIIGCENLEYLFGDIQGLKKLQTLVIRHCHSLVSLPPSVKFLAALKTQLLLKTL